MLHTLACYVLNNFKKSDMHWTNSYFNVIHKNLSSLMCKKLKRKKKFSNCDGHLTERNVGTFPNGYIYQYIQYNE